MHTRTLPVPNRPSIAAGTILAVLLAIRAASAQYPPSAPVPTATGQCNGILVTWTASTPGSPTYYVDRSVPTSGIWNTVSITNGLSYLDTNTAPGVQFLYRVQACNVYGCSGYIWYSVIAARLGTPAAPASLSASDGTTCSAITVSWAAVSGASGYQLFKNTANNAAGASMISAPGGTSYTDFSVAPGTTYWYWAKAVNPCATSGFSPGDAGSSGTPPQIVASPVSQPACPGSTVILSVTAAGASLAYQWRRNGVPLAGATSASLTLVSITSSQAGGYDAVVSNPCGSVASSPAILTVMPAPAIASQPQPAAVCAGSPASFTVSAQPGGIATLAYQWRKNGTPVAGATAATLAIAAAGAADAGLYSVTVSEGACSVTSANAALTVNGIPVVTAHPQPAAACGTATASFSVTATGSTGLAWQWRSLGVPIPGATASTLSGIAAVLGPGPFDVVVSGPCGATTSAAAALTILDPAAITTHPVSQAVCAGDPVSLSVAATGSGTLTYQWSRNGTPIPGATGSTLVIAAAAAADSGAYTATASNGCSSATSDPADVVIMAPAAGSWTPLAAGLPGDVEALVYADLGSGPRLFAAREDPAAGPTQRFGVAAFDGIGWSPVGTGFNGVVLALAVFDAQDGYGPNLYAGGAFSTSGSTAVARIARWNGSSWMPLATGLNNDVLALAVFDPGTGPALYAGGRFSSAGGAAAARIARWNGTSWAALGAGLSGTVEALAVHDAGGGPALFAGGAFSSAGGLPASRVARWNGSAWSALGAGLQGGGTIFALASHDDGSGPALYAGGDAMSSGGLPNSRLWRWDGAAWTSPGSGINGRILALLSFDDGSGPGLLAGGEFGSAGGAPAARVARLAGGTWSALGPGLDDRVPALAADEGPLRRRLFAGGEFDDAGGLAAARVAAWDPRHFNLELLLPAGPGSLGVRHACGVPGALVFTALSLDPANASAPGEGAVFGLHIGLDLLIAEVQTGAPPFVTVLDAQGAASFAFPAGAFAPLSGGTIHGVAAAFDPVNVRLIAISTLASRTLP